MQKIKWYYFLLHYYEKSRFSRDCQLQCSCRYHKIYYLLYILNPFVIANTFLQLLSVEEACHKILVLSNANEEGAVDIEKNITIVDYNHVQDAITRCLEEPVRDLLHKWDLLLNNEDNTEEALLIRTDIENIRKQLLCEEYKTDRVPLSSNEGTQSIIPEDIKTYLERYLLITISNY